MQALLPGLKAMLNYHPLFVHFPIGLWVAALLFEVLAVVRSSEEWHRTAVRLLYLGTLFAFVAAGTGWVAEEAVPSKGPAFEAKELHERLMVITTSVAVGLCLFAFFARKRFTQRLRVLFLVGLVVLAGFLTVGADRGALLVYKYATSVNLPSAK